MCIRFHPSFTVMKHFLFVGTLQVCVGLHAEELATSERHDHQLEECRGTFNQELRNVNDTVAQVLGLLHLAGDPLSESERQPIEELVNSLISQARQLAAGEDL